MLIGRVRKQKTRICMKGIILAAGLGKRLRPFTKNLPKPMLSVGGRPIVVYTIRLFKKFGIKDVIINLHYKPEAIINYLRDGKKLGVRITYSYEPVLLGTAGAVKNVAHLLRKTFIVAYGDTLRNINISGALKAHKEKRADLTIALYKAGDSQGCGIVNLRSNNSISRFVEKPRGIKDISHRYANSGFYIIEPKILDYIPSGKPYDFSTQLFPFLIKRGFRIYGYPTDSYLLDIGSRRSYAKAKKVSSLFKDL